MQDLYLWISIAIGLSTFGFIVSFLEGLKQRRRVLDSLPMDTAESILEDETPPREKISGKTLIFVILSVPSLMYTFLVSALVLVYSPLTTVEQRVAAGALISVGLSTMFTNLGRALYYKECMNGLNEWDGGSVDFFGRYNVLLTHPETTSVYGLLYAVLGLTLSGITGRIPDTINMAAADKYFIASVILGISGIGAVLMGMVFRKIKPLYEDKEYFGKKILYTIMPHFVNLTGLIVALFIMVTSGMM